MCFWKGNTYICFTVNKGNFVEILYEQLLEMERTRRRRMDRG